MTKTKIEWADRVWNPVTGCTKVSEGCRHCYAERLAGRFWGDRKFSDVQVHPDRLSQPLSWKKPSRVFVNSMSDLFHPDIDHDFIGDVFRMMEKTPQHTYLILTKRPKEMLYWFNLMNAERFLPNVWLGVSVEDQKTADERIPLLLQTPAAVRFVSCEPLLGELDLWQWLAGCRKVPEIYGTGINWVIVGGESGKNARPMNERWVHSIKHQCVLAEVPFFFKQWGEWAEIYEAGEGWYCLLNKKGNEIMTRIPNKSKILENTWDGRLIARVGKKSAGRLLGGKEWNQFPTSETQEVM